MIHENLFPSTNQDSTIFFTWENLRMFNITAKYFIIFNNKPPTSWVAHGIFVHVIPVRIIVPSFYQLRKYCNNDKQTKWISKNKSVILGFYCWFNKRLVNPYFLQNFSVQKTRKRQTNDFRKSFFIRFIQSVYYYNPGQNIWDKL